MEDICVLFLFDPGSDRFWGMHWKHQTGRFSTLVSEMLIRVNAKLKIFS